jgi:fatty-acyl-CoA synthase
MQDSKNIADIAERIRKQDPDDPTNIQYTSGTTGAPKATTLTHLNILNNAYFIGERLNFTHKDSVVIAPPLYHCFGMVLGVLTMMCRGSTSVICSEGFSPQDALQAVSDYKCTGLHGVPTMFIEYLKVYEANKDKYDISRLKKGIMAGTLCPIILME